MKRVNLDTFDADKFLEDHKGMIEIGATEEGCVPLVLDIDGAHIDDARLYLQARAYGRTPWVKIPRLLKGELESEVARLKNALKIIAYLAPYCQEEVEDGNA